MSSDRIPLSRSVPMAVGKVPPEILESLVFRKIDEPDPRILVAPGTGEDCSVLDLGDRICVLSCDPITGASNDVGKLAVHVSCNDIASAGLAPLGLMVTILLPPGATPAELDAIMSDLSGTAADLNVRILGGHTEVTDAVSRVVVMTTVIGIADKKEGRAGGVVTTAGAMPGDFLIMTKTAGLEGTAIIAKDRAASLEKVLGKETVSRAQAMIGQISVLEEGIIGGLCGVSSMHDATEGGIFGAVWETAQASGCGVILEKDKIPVAPETVLICRHYGLSPYRLISSGCLVLTAADPKPLLERLAEKKIPAAVIGRMTKEKEYRVVSGPDGAVEEPLDIPGPDELYRLSD